MSQCPKCNSDLIYEIKGSSYVIKFATKTHRLACGMKVAFLLDININ